jgi:NAD(P)-dependent dehydrogenase (short-subunit alcohol dehydrogenase family)
MGQTVSAFDVVGRVAPQKNEFSSRGAAVVTGSTSGIGIPTVESMLLAGFDRVFVTARNDAAAAALIKDLETKYGADLAKKVVVVSMDLGDLKTVKAGAERIERESGPAGVSVVLCNAGIMGVPYRATVDGLEAQIGTNHFGHTLLVDTLLPALRRAGANSVAKNPTDVSRVVFTSSAGHAMAPGDEGFVPDMFEYDAAKSGRYGEWRAYGQSKMANVLAALDYDTDFQKEKLPIAAFSLHPGVIYTNLGREVTGFGVFGFVSKPFLKNVGQGAATQVFCALDPTALAHRGGYFADAKFKGADTRGQNIANAARLMTVTRDILKAKVQAIQQQGAAATTVTE